MLNTGIEGYIGSWVSAAGQRIIVEKCSRRTLSVSLFGVDGCAIIRPYMNQAPAEKLRGRFDDIEGFLDVELWYPKSGFVLSLLHEFDPLPNGTWRHFLAPALVRNEGDVHLDAYYPVFGKLEAYFPEPNQSLQHNAIARPFSVFESRSSRG
jgi:hypothetical protein